MDRLPAIGEKVEWTRAGAPFGGHMEGYVRKIYDFHGAMKAKVQSNGRVYAVLVTKLRTLSW